MNANLQRSRAEEQSATATAPMPLPRHDGERRYQTTLDADQDYKRLVLGAVLLALWAGSGFGQLPRQAGWLPAVLWSVTVAGLAARCVAPRPAWRRGSVEPLALASTLRLIAGLTAGGAGLASLRSGAVGLLVCATALVVAGVLWFVRCQSQTVIRLTVPVLLALGSGILYLLTKPHTPLEALLVCGAGCGIAAVVAITAGAPGGPVNLALALTRLAAIGWVFGTWGAALQHWTAVFPFLAAGVGLVALDIFTIRRQYFAATAATVALVHLAALPPPQELLHAPLWLQLPVAAAEYVLLILAGLRHVQAAFWRLPNATYRIAPLCIVPRLDRAWDHPVKINVA